MRHLLAVLVACGLAGAVGAQDLPPPKLDPPTGPTETNRWTIGDTIIVFLSDGSTVWSIPFDMPPLERVTVVVKWDGSVIVTGTTSTGLTVGLTSLDGNIYLAVMDRLLSLMGILSSNPREVAPPPRPVDK